MEVVFSPGGWIQRQGHVWDSHSPLEGGVMWEKLVAASSLCWVWVSVWWSWWVGLRQFTPSRDEQKCSDFLKGEKDRPWKITWSSPASLVLDGSIWMLWMLTWLCWNGLQLLDSHLFSLGIVQTLTIGGSWFGLIFNAGFPCLGGATVLILCRAEESTVLVMAPRADQQFGAKWLG